MTIFSSRPSRVQQRRRRQQRMVLIVVITIIGAAAVAYIANRSDQGGNTLGTPSAGGPAIPTTGNYAEDWQRSCGQREREEQVGCTARLDAAYGREAGAPVPRDN